jgi:hypothetical protein
MMTASGATVLMDRADDLKAVDNAWRSRHPEQAALEQIGD